MDCLNHSGRLVKTRRDSDGKTSTIETGADRGRSILNRDLSLAVTEGELPSELDREYALPADIRNRVDRSRITLSPSRRGKEEATEQQS